MNARVVKLASSNIQGDSKIMLGFLNETILMENGN